MKKTLLCSFATLLPLIGNAEEIHKDNEFQDPDYETPGYVITPKATTALMQEMQPTMKFGGYIMASHVNYKSGSGTPFLVPHYPLNQMVLRLGISWNFFN